MEAMTLPPEHKAILATCLHVLPSRDDMHSQLAGVTLKQLPPLTWRLYARGAARAGTLLLDADKVTFLRPRDDLQAEVFSVRWILLAS